MTKKRRVEITVEQRSLVLRRPVKGASAVKETVMFCPHCASPTISPEQAAALTGVSTRAVYRQVEQGQLHFVETETGRLMLCLNSLLEHKGDL